MKRDNSTRSCLERKRLKGKTGKTKKSRIKRTFKKPFNLSLEKKKYGSTNWNNSSP